MNMILEVATFLYQSHLKQVTDFYRIRIYIWQQEMVQEQVYQFLLKVT